VRREGKSFSDLSTAEMLDRWEKTR